MSNEIGTKITSSAILENSQPADSDIYLDNAATSYPKPLDVIEAITKSITTISGSPQRGEHNGAVDASNVIENTRQSLATLFNAEHAMEIAFSMNATHALNMAIKGILDQGDHVIFTDREHNSVVRPIVRLESELDIEKSIVSLSDPDAVSSGLEKVIKPNTKLIICTHASNVTGEILPIEAVGDFAKQKSLPFLVDASQSAGAIPIDVQANNISMLAFTGHKSLLGPTGTGGLYINKAVELRTLMEGGTGTASEELSQPARRPYRYESGTHNLVGLAGLGAGVNYHIKNRKLIQNNEKALIEILVDGLRAFGDEVVVYGHKPDSQSTGIVSFNLSRFESSADVGYALQCGFGIKVRTGLHCAPLAHECLGTTTRGTVRASVGPFNTPSDIERLLAAIQTLLEF